MSKTHKGVDIVESLMKDWRREQPGVNVKAMAVVGRVIRLGSLLQKQTSQVLKPYQLSFTEFDVLATLRRLGDPFQATPGELRRSALITSGAMTACLDRLERTKLVRRSPDPNDRRGTLVKITAKGKNLIDKAIVSRFQSAEKAVDSLTAQEAKTLAKLLRKLTLATPAK